MPFPLVQKSAISDACSRSDVSFYVLFRFRYINLCSKIQKDPSEQRSTFESFSSDAQPLSLRSDWSFSVSWEMKQSLLSRESLNKFVLFRQMVWTSLSPLLGRGRVLIFAKKTGHVFLLLLHRMYFFAALTNWTMSKIFMHSPCLG